MVTIFTPTYNRAYILPKLYESLCKQTCMDFEWVIVDDGSTDGTEELVCRFERFEKFDEFERFPIRYFKQENGGKHRAINRGVQEARGELFFIVDSDDRLTEDAVEWIRECYDKIRGEERFAGLSGIRIRPDGSRIGGCLDYKMLDTDALSLRLVEKIDGDMAEIYRTQVLRAFPFPVFERERFCPEALVWNRIAQKYMLRYVNHGIYVCEYLPDGLTAKIDKLRHRSPLASMTYYSELMHLPISAAQKLKANINFWRFAPVRLWYRAVDMQMLNLWSIGGLPLGCLYAMIDRIKSNL